MDVHNSYADFAPACKTRRSPFIMASTIVGTLDVPVPQSLWIPRVSALDSTAVY
ncbi:MAG: hypothetical protein HW394_659 [Acidobacteria bacterium]|nr:hypothetical protein [Acidobacteriota bacterium]